MVTGRDVERMPCQHSRLDGRARSTAEDRTATGKMRGVDDAERAVDLAPASAYEALTRQMVDRLTVDLAEIKSRLDGLLFMVAGAIVLDLVIRLATVP